MYLYILVCFLCSFVCMFVFCMCLLYNGSPIMEDNKESINQSKFSLVLRTRENFDVFNSLDEIYLVFTSKK